MLLELIVYCAKERNCGVAEGTMTWQTQNTRMECNGRDISDGREEESRSSLDAVCRYIWLYAYICCKAGQRSCMLLR